MRGDWNGYFGFSKFLRREKINLQDNKGWNQIKFYVLLLGFKF